MERFLRRTKTIGDPDDVAKIVRVDYDVRANCAKFLSLGLRIRRILQAFMKSICRTFDEVDIEQKVQSRANFAIF